MVKFFSFLQVLLALFLLILQWPELSFITDIYPVIGVLILLFMILCVFIQRFLGVKLAPLQKTMATVLKTHLYINSAITVTMPNKNKLKLWGLPIAMVDSLKKGDLVYIEYKGWEVVKIKKVDSKTENKPAKPAKPTKASKRVTS